MTDPSEKRHSDVSWRECGCVVLLGFLAMLLAAVFLAGTSDRGVRRASCANNLKMMGLALKMYANESPGQRFPRQMYYHDIEVDCDDSAYPPASTEKQTHLGMMFNLDDMYPNYLPDLAVVVCPSLATKAGRGADDFVINERTGQLDMHRKCADPERGWHMADNSYWYVSHLLEKTGPDAPVSSTDDYEHISAACLANNETPQLVNTQLATWLELAGRNIDDNPETAGHYLDSDWDLRVNGLESAGNGTTRTLFRLREGVERILWTNITVSGPAIQITSRRRSTIPIIYDVPTTDPTRNSHVLHGGNVLFMDGHAEFVKYPGRFPFNRGIAGLADCLDTRPEDLYRKPGSFLGCHCDGS